MVNNLKSLVFAAVIFFSTNFSMTEGFKAEPSVSNVSQENDETLSSLIEKHFITGFAECKKIEDCLKLVPCKRHELLTNFVEETLLDPKVKSICNSYFDVEVISGSLAESLEMLKKDPTNLSIFIQITAQAPAYSYFCKETKKYKIFLLQEFIEYLRSNSNNDDELIKAILRHEIWHVISKDLERKDFFVKQMIKSSYPKISNQPSFANLTQGCLFCFQSRESLADAFAVLITNDKDIVMNAIKYSYAFIETLGFSAQNSPAHPLFKMRLEEAASFLNRTEDADNHDKNGKKNFDYLVRSGIVSLQSELENVASELIDSSDLKHFLTEKPKIEVKTIFVEPSILSDWIFLQEGFCPTISKFNSSSNKYEIFLVANFFETISDLNLKEELIKVALARELSVMLLEIDPFDTFAKEQINQWQELYFQDESLRKMTNIVLEKNLSVLKFYSLIKDIASVAMFKNKRMFESYLNEVENFAKKNELLATKSCLTKESRMFVINSSFPS